MARQLAVLELFCGAGLATRGLMREGAREIYGIDSKPQKRWPGYSFGQYDITKPSVRDFLLALGRECDFVWASPPCQFGSVMRHAPGAKKHLNLIPYTRELLQEIGKPYCIENVEGARDHLRDPITLDGGMFGLGVFLNSQWFRLERRRCFETSWKMKQPKFNEYATGPAIGVYGSHARVRAASAGGRGTSWPFELSQREAASGALGLQLSDGLTLAEMSQGIPPAYAAHILRSFKRAHR